MTVMNFGLPQSQEVVPKPNDPLRYQGNKLFASETVKRPGGEPIKFGQTGNENIEGGGSGGKDLKPERLDTEVLTQGVEIPNPSQHSSKS